VSTDTFHPARDVDVPPPASPDPGAAPSDAAATIPALGRPLRVGLLVDGLVQPAWIDAVLAELVQTGTAELSLVILNASSGAPSAGRRGLLARAAIWYRNRRLLPYELYSKLDAWRYRPTNDPFKPVDITARVAGAPVVRVTPRQTKFCDYFPDAVVDEIVGHDLDVVLRFGFRILKGRALQVARHGVWSFHHGDNTVNRGGPAGFWEVMDRHPATGAVLQRLTEELDGGQILARAASSTNFNSVTVNRANYYWQAAALLTRELRRLQEEGPAEAPPEDAEWSAYGAPLYTSPTAGMMARLALRLAGRLVRSKVDEVLRREQWFLAYVLRTAAPGEEDVPHGVLYRFKELLPPPDRYWADPFPVVDGGRNYVFFEEHPFDSPNAHIAVLEIDAKGVVEGSVRTVLRRDYHLSYPGVFRWNGSWYMVPETLSRRSVEVYRATRFPDEWEPVGPMLRDVDAVDATIAEIDGQWWLFAGVVIPGATEATALHLYHGPSPLGPWTPHRRNPVRVDVRGARPAGRLFRHDGRWYRPGQDGAPRYGSAVIVHRIDELTPTRYRETAVSRVAPTWRPGLRGTHTLNAAGGLTVIDALRPLRRW
jgi:hypothetical protein